MKAAVDNAADPEQVKNARKGEKRRQDRKVEDLRTVLSTVNGRRYLWELMAKCNVFSSVFAQEPTTMAFKEGMRNVGLMVLADLNTAGPEWYSLMLKENSNVDD